MNKTLPTKEKVLRAFDEVIQPLYLEVDASIAEDIHVKVAQKAQELLSNQQARLKERIEGMRKKRMTEEEIMEVLRINSNNVGFGEVEDADARSVGNYNEALDEVLKLLEEDSVKRGKE